MKLIAERRWTRKQALQSLPAQGSAPTHTTQMECALVGIRKRIVYLYVTMIHVVG